MQVAVIGNCQIDSLARCLSAMNGGLAATPHSINEFSIEGEELEKILSTNEFVFAQPSMRGLIGDRFREKVHYFPAIAFSAFHPDLTFVRAKNARGEGVTVSNPLSGYHSMIALFGYKSGISIDDIASFYHAGVYARLGYFDQWSDSRRQLLDEGDRCGMPLNAMFARWAEHGPFMYSSNHPRLAVMEDIARELLRRIGVTPTCDSVSDLIADPLRAMPIWPIYPEIAQRLELNGNMIFKPHEPEPALSLRQFIEASYACFDAHDRDSLEAVNGPVEDVRRRLGFAGPVSEHLTPRHPYAGLPKHQFWREAVASVEPAKLDPVIEPRFAISNVDKVATAGSCFAQHIARTLKAKGFNYFVAETAPQGLDSTQAQALNYDVFSARYGNIYTVRQLLQLIERAEGRFAPRISSWERADGKLVDPFRPQIVPDGFSNMAELLAARDEHLSIVKTMLREMDVFVFTLGLTEGWRARFDGAVYPLAPGVAGGIADPDEYEFVNFDVDSVRSDMHAVIALLKEINLHCRIILTVSPVPLIATYEPQHALVATTYSKAVLRVVADEISHQYSHVDYFPSYEIITGSYNRGAYFADDLREVVPDGVAHVMGVFMRNYAGAEQGPHTGTHAKPAPQTPRNAFFDIVCDEEMLAKF